MVHPAICKLLDDLNDITSKQHFSFNDFINSFDLINFLILIMCHSFSLISIIKKELTRVIRDKEEEFFSYLDNYEKVKTLIN
jgi:hypothetical protein